MVKTGVESWVLVATIGLVTKALVAVEATTTVVSVMFIMVGTGGTIDPFRSKEFVWTGCGVHQDKATQCKTMQWCATTKWNEVWGQREKQHHQSSLQPTYSWNFKKDSRRTQLYLPIIHDGRDRSRPILFFAITTTLLFSEGLRLEENKSLAWMNQKINRRKSTLKIRTSKLID